MPKAIKLLFLSCFLLFQSCEDDEICIESLSAKLNTSITASDSTSVFSIKKLTITDLTDGANILVFNEAASSFKVFLPTDKISATYKIGISFASSDSLQSKPEISETLTINYSTQNEFISKACGFKILYKDLDFSITGTPLSINTFKSVITNDNETHLNLQY